MDFLSFLFPKQCLSCGKTGRYFCIECRKKIKNVFQVCPVCEKATPFGQTHSFCLTRYSPEGLISFFAYEGIIKEAVHKLKYRLMTDIEKEFWMILKGEFDKRKEELIVFERFIKERKPVVIPVPLYYHKENLRGFNQASLFGERIAGYYNLQFSNKVLIRKKNVISQTKLSQKERKENVKGIFSINAYCKQPTVNCLIVDDIWTTGATLKEAVKVLKQAGVKQVWGLTVAR